MEYTGQEIQAFIERHLAEHTDQLVQTFSDALRENENIQSGDLLRSVRRVSVRPDASGNVTAELEFNVYGRFMEIQGRNRQRNRNRQSATGTHRTKKKRTRWYNRNMYYGWGRLIATLSAGISENELQHIRSIFARYSPNNSNLSP